MTPDPGHDPRRRARAQIGVIGRFVPRITVMTKNDLHSMRWIFRPGGRGQLAKPVTGHSVFSRALLAPGDVGIGTHSARGRHSTCAMAPKPMEYEITDGRRGDETLAQQSPRESSRVRGGLLTVILGTNLPMTPDTRGPDITTDAHAVSLDVHTPSRAPPGDHAHGPRQRRRPASVPPRAAPCVRCRLRSKRGPPHDDCRRTGARRSREHSDLRDRNRRRGAGAARAGVGE